MRSWNFPDFFKGSEVQIIDGIDSAKSCLQLLLESEIFEFRFDPAYGSKLNLLLLKPYSLATNDLIKDAIYELQQFCPNIRYRREDAIVTKTDIGHLEIQLPVTIDLSTDQIDIVLIAQTNS